MSDIKTLFPGSEQTAICDDDDGDRKHKHKHKRKHKSKHKKKHHKRHDDRDDRDDPDYVIVGLGTAGAVLARFLSDPIDGEFKNSVLVIEAGSNFTTGGDPVDRARVAQGAPFGDEGVGSDSKFSTFQKMETGEAAPGFIGYTAGRMWGGSSAHNDLLTVRSSPDVYDDWAIASGSAQWSYDSLLPFMKFMEKYLPNGTIANLAQRGVAGALTISQDPPLAGDPGLAAIQTAIASGANAPLVSDYNDPTLGNVGVAAFQWYSTPPPSTQRSSSSQAYLPTSVVTPDGHGVGGRKLTIISEATTLHIIMDTSGSVPEARGIRYFENHNRDVVLTTRARKKVILCAGTVPTAAILQRSGIGDPALLAQYGIPVVVANPNVGKNTYNHYGPGGTIPIGGNPIPAFQGVIVNVDLSGTVVHPTDQTTDGVRRYQLLGFVGQEFFPCPALFTAQGEQDVPSFTFFGNSMIPKATGSVEIASVDPLTPPNFSVDCYEDSIAPTDLDRAVQALRVIANISLAYTGLMPLWPPAAHFPITDAVPYPGAAAPDDSILRLDAKELSNQAFHLVGSCRMAASATDGVVDANLDVFGVGKLAICDNSVIPRITTGNTSYPAYLLGLKKAQLEGAQIP